MNSSPCVCGENSLCMVWGRFSLSGVVSPLLPEKSYLTANIYYLLDSLVALPIVVRCSNIYLHRQVRGSCRVPARSLWPVPASKYVRLQCCSRVLLLVAARLGGVKTYTPLTLRRDRQPSSLTRGKRAGLAVAAQLSSLPFSVAGTGWVGQSNDIGR